MRHFRSIKTLIAAAALLVSHQAAGVVVYVDADASGANTGTSWADAYVDLQAALASGADEIWVAEGTYKPGAVEAGKIATFRVESGLRLYGGFAGDESSLSERNPEQHRTILSGDLAGDDAPGWVNMQADNSYHVVTLENADATTRLDGFTVTAGWAWVAAGTNSGGAGILVSGGEPVIAQCTIHTNLAHLGAGILALNAAPLVTDCLINGNLASDGRGGGAYYSSENPVTCTVRDSVFRNNTATPGGGPGDAGAIWIGQNTGLTVLRCLFEDNEARWRFTYGSFAAVGGAIVQLGGPSRIEACIFRGNRAHEGGAIWTGRDVDIVNCLFVANEAFRVSSGAYDYGGFGGAMLVANGVVNVINCSLFANHSRTAGGIIQTNGTLAITNSILWQNTSTEVDATLLDNNFQGSAAISYSVVEGLLTPIPGEDPPNPNDYPGSLDTDPFWSDPDGIDDFAGNDDDDLQLTAGSPCIDAGNNEAVPLDIDTDLAGNLRFIDDLDTADVGLGDAPLVDMGAYEFGGVPPEPLIGDVNDDGVENAVDVQLVINSALGLYTGYDCDLNSDDVVNAVDVQMVINAVLGR